MTGETRENAPHFDFSKWNRREALVKRSSGEIEKGWYVQGDTGKGVLVVKYENDVQLQKVIPHKEFLNLNEKERSAENAERSKEGKDNAETKDDKFDINKWNRLEVYVKRSSGEIEKGWHVVGDTGKGVLVTTEQKGKFIRKEVPYDEFAVLNRDSDLEIGENKSPSEKIGGEDIENKIGEIGSNRKELMNFLDSVDGVQGSGKFYEAAYLKKKANEVLDKLKNVDASDKRSAQLLLSDITRTGGLRNKVQEIFLAEKKI